MVASRPVCRSTLVTRTASSVSSPATKRVTTSREIGAVTMA